MFYIVSDFKHVILWSKNMFSTWEVHNILLSSDLFVFVRYIRILSDSVLLKSYLLKFSLYRLADTTVMVKQIFQHNN